MRNWLQLGGTQRPAWIQALRATVPALAGSAALAVMPTLAGAATIISSVTITDVSVYAGSSAQGAYVLFSPAQPNVEGCTLAAGNELWIDFASPAQPDGKTLYATVLSAVMAGKAVSFAVSGCSQNGQVPLVYRVDVRP